MKRFLILVLVTLSYTFAYADGKFYSESDAQRYFAQNIGKLDPIEGIYDVNNTVVATIPGFGSQRSVQDFVWAIYKHNDKFLVQSLSGPITGLISYILRIGETNYYKLIRFDKNQKQHEERFELSGLFSFGYSYQDYYMSANSTVTLRAYKKYPTRSMYEEEIKRAAAEVRKAEEKAAKPTKWSGTGFALKDGYIVTNYHVIEDAKSILIKKGDKLDDYDAKVIAVDKNNDLAILRISDSRFTGFGTIPYALKSQIVDVGEDVWVLGYPLTQYLGNEIKLTTGIISSRSGYQGNVATYQISAPVQPGNSGGPLFDLKGNIVGIVNAGVPGADNVGYAIKTTYLKNLVDSYDLSTILPEKNTISSLSLKEQVKCVDHFVFLIICSSEGSHLLSSNNSSTSRSVLDNSQQTQHVNEKSFSQVSSNVNSNSATKSSAVHKDDYALYIDSAEAGDAISQCRIGYCYYSGNGVEKDLSKAEYWFKKSADNGNVVAKSWLKALKKNNNSVNEAQTSSPLDDFNKYIKAAKAGDAVAQNKIASCYYNGEGVEKDISKAEYWYKKSAKQGNVIGKSWLSIIQKQNKKD